MSYVKDLVSLIGKSAETTQEENFNFYELTAEISELGDISVLLKPLEEKLEIAKKNSINLELTLRFDGQEPVRFTSNNIDNLQTELEEYTDRVELNQSSVSLEVRIDKPDDSLHIFDMETFSTYHRSLNLEECFKNWSSYDYTSKLEIQVWDVSKPFETGSMTCFSVYPKNGRISNSKAPIFGVKRTDIISNRDKCGHFANANQIAFIPDDFRLVKQSKSNSLEEDLPRLFNTLLIVYLSDFTSIDENELKYRLKGYKLVSETISSQQLKNLDLNELDDIYNWTYGEGDFSDKIGLSRNIISIHLTKDSILSIESGTADSVRSGYDLYLRENVKQYIDIKNKISEFILSQSDKAGEIPKNMFGMFKTSLWTFTTFFISVFLLRIFKSDNLEGSFSIEVLFISLLLILFSFVFLVVTTSELNSDRDRLLSKYSQISDRYKDLLDKKDLQKIFNAEELKKKESNYINKKRNRYVCVWLVTNLMLLIAVSSMYCYTKTEKAPVPSEKPESQPADEAKRDVKE